MIQKPKGTKDLLPEESYKWQEVEKKVKQILDNYNFKEIRVPVFEYTELFQRGVGETTDVVQKEMYTFDDKGRKKYYITSRRNSWSCKSIYRKWNVKFNKSIKIMV